MKKIIPVFILLLCSAGFYGFVTYKNTLCHKSLLKKIKDRDTLYLSSSMIGCFGGSDETVKIYRDGTVLLAALKSSRHNIAATAMTQTSINSYRILEKKIEKFNSSFNGCTSSYTFALVLNKDSVKAIDNGCRLSSFYSEFINSTFTFPKEGDE